MKNLSPVHHLGIMGGTGFVGSHVVNALIDQNVKVTILPREAATSHVKLKQVIVDHAMRGDEFDGVIGASWAHTGRMDYRNNIENHKWAESTINSYEVLSGLGIPFVGLGTCLEKLDYPTDEYTKAKILVSDYFKAMESKYDWTWLRLHYLYSKNPPRPRLIEEASTVYTKGGVMILKNPEARHDYIEITEATKLIACAVFGRHFGIRDIGSGHLKSNAELLNEIYPTLRIESGENIETLSGYQGLADIEYLK